MTKEIGLKFDEIGYWSELKLEIVEKYGAAYTNAFKGKGKSLKKYYIDAFSGSGVHISKKSGGMVPGSPLRALEIEPPFDEYYFIDLSQEKTEHLKQICKDKEHVHIYTGDCNEFLISEILPNVKYERRNRALCLLDPYGLHLNWEVILIAGQSNAIDMFLNFPIMDMNRNAIWRNPDKVPLEGIKRMNKFWGDESWKEIAYTEEPDLFGHYTKKQENESIVNAFIERVKNVAGFQYVAKPLPMKNSVNAVVYYLLFASQKPVAIKIIKDIYKKYS